MDTEDEPVVRFNIQGSVSTPSDHTFVSCITAILVLEQCLMHRLAFVSHTGHSLGDSISSWQLSAAVNMLITKSISVPRRLEASASKLVHNDSVYVPHARRGGGGIGEQFS